MSGTTRLHLRVAGRVQGVGFRWFVREAARREGLAGWVRNNPDGTVELEVEGRAAAVEAIAVEVARGPDGARVEQVSRLTPTGDDLPRPFALVR